MSAWLSFSEPRLLLGLVFLPVVWWLERQRTLSLASDRLELWERAARRLGHLRRPRRLEHWLSLLAFAALIVAAAGARRPEVPGYEQHWVVVDLSPSMATRDSGPRGEATRLAAALERLTALRAELPVGIACQAFALDGDLVRPLDALPVLGTQAARLEAALALAARQPSRACVTIFADGAGPSPWPAALPANVWPVPLGAAATANGGMVEAELLDPWPGPEVGVRLRLAGFAGRRLVVVRPGAPAEERPLPGADPGDVELALPRGGGGSLRLELQPTDALAADDGLDLFVQPPWAPQLLVLPESSAELQALADFLVATLAARRAASREELSAEPDAARRLLLVAGGSFESWPSDGASRLLFGTRLPGLSADAPFLRAPEWDRTHALLHGLELSALRGSERRGKSGELPPGVEILAWADGDPLLAVSVPHRLLWIGCDPATSNVAVQAFLPVLALRCLARFAPSGAKSRIGAPLVAGEADVAARPAPERSDAPIYRRPALDYWPHLAVLAAGALVVRTLLRRLRRVS